MNITEAGNNLIAIQNRLLNEKQALVDEKERQQQIFNAVERAQLIEHGQKTAFLSARIAEIDSMIGADEVK